MRQFIQFIKTLWRADRAACVAAAACVACGWLPLLTPDHIPMQDMPAHMELLSAWRRLLCGEALTHYALVPGAQPYLLTYLLAAPLAMVAGEAWALRLLCMAYVVAMPLSAAYMLRAYDRDARLALFAAALTHNTVFLYGFIPNALAYPLLFVLLGSFRRALLAPTWQREACNAALLMALYMTHLSGALAFAVAGPIVLLAHTRGDVSQLLRRGAFVAPALAAALWWRAGALGAPLELTPQTWAGSARTAVTWLARATFTRWDFLYVAVIVATWLALWALAARQRGAREHARADWALGAAGVGLACLYLVMPFTIHAPILQIAANTRMLVPAAVCLAGAPRVRLGGRARWLLAPLGAACVIWCAALTKQAHTLDPQLQQIQPILAALPADATVVIVSWDTLHAGTFWQPFKHMPRLHALRGDGVVAGGFADARDHGIMPVRYTRDWPAPPGDEGRTFSYEAHARWFDYVVLLSAAPVPLTEIPGGPQHLEVVRRDGVFTLMRVR